MALTAADIDALDRAIASGALTVRAADGSSVTYRSMAELLQARAEISRQLTTAATDPALRPGGVSYAEWGRD